MAPLLYENCWISPEGSPFNIGNAKHSEWIANRLKITSPADAQAQALSQGWVRISSSSFGRLPGTMQTKAAIGSLIHKSAPNRADLNVIINYGQEALPPSPLVIHAITEITRHLDEGYNTVHYGVEITSAAASPPIYSECLCNTTQLRNFISTRHLPDTRCEGKTETAPLSQLEKGR